MKPASLAVLLFVLVSSFYVCVGHGQRSGLILMTLPIQAPSGLVTSLGWSSIRGSSLLPSENWYTVVELLYFNGLQGIETGIPFTITRGYYSFVAALLSPFLGIFKSFILINWLTWAFCVWVTWRLSMRLTRNAWAAFWAVAAACGGLGFIIHIHDYSAHILSFAAYYFGVYLLYTSGIFLKRRPWRTHALLASYFSAIFLIYNNGIMLLAAYGILAFRKNKFWHIAAVAVAVLATRPLWIFYLHAMGVYFDDVEAHFLSTALKAWGGIFQGSLIAAGQRTVLMIGEFLSFDFPLLILAGFVGAMQMTRRAATRWFGAVLMAVPIGASLYFAPIASARGYLVYGVSLWIYCGLGYLLATWRQKRMGVVGLVILLAGHFAWSSAHLWRQLAPVQTYFVGWDGGLRQLVHPPTKAYSMTGLEATPILYGGEGSIAQAGGVHPSLNAESPLFSYSFSHALLRRLPLVLHLAFIIWLWLPQHRKRVIGLWGFLLAMTLSSAFLSAHGLPGTPRRFPVWRNFSLPPGAGAQYQIRLSPAFLDALDKAREPHDTLAVQIPFVETPPAIQLSAGGRIGLDRDENCRWGPQLACLRDPTAALSSLRQSGEMVIDLKNGTQTPMDFIGWQRADLAGRSWSSTREVTTPGAIFGHPTPLPAVEIRLYRADGTLKIIGF